MLTVDYTRLGIGPGSTVIDVGCGAGRHSFEAYRRGADVIAFDQNAEELADVDTMLQAMGQAGEAPKSAKAQVVVGDALALPYPDATFDTVIASEILEHIPDDDAAIAELIRVLKPGGSLAVTVPRWLPERICWLTPTTPTRAVISASTAPTNYARSLCPVDWSSPDLITPMRCTRRTGGSNVLWAWITATMSPSRPTTSCWCGT